MPLPMIVASKPPRIERPYCPKCGSLMWLARIMPHEPGWDQRTFECADCGHQVTRFFKWRSSVKSAI